MDHNFLLGGRALFGEFLGLRLREREIKSEETEGERERDPSFSLFPSLFFPLSLFSLPPPPPHSFLHTVDDAFNTNFFKKWSLLHRGGLAAPRGGGGGGGAGFWD